MSNHLSDEQKRILHNKGTEPAWTGALLENKKDGMYHCADCGAELFESSNKFDSGSGWPSFDQAINTESIKLITDTSHGMVRTEVVCANCGGHLGHVFNDGPADTTGQRYCINSCSLNFKGSDGEEIRGDGQGLKA